MCETSYIQHNDTLQNIFEEHIEMCLPGAMGVLAPSIHRESTAFSNNDCWL